MLVQGGPPRVVRCAQDSLLSRDTPPARLGQSLRDGHRSLPEDAVDPGLASRWEAGLSRMSGTGSASTAGAAWKRKRRSPEVFKGDAALIELRSRLAGAPADQTLEPPPAPVKTPIFVSTARLRGVILAAGGALGFLWVTPANQQAGEEAALASLRDTSRPEAQTFAAERAPDPLAAAEQAAGAALYQDFLKWRQLQGR
jgi:hypothetical protein